MSACLVCDDPNPKYDWTDYSGEATCARCGTPYQLKWGDKEDTRPYPQINVHDDRVAALRRYWAETGRQNGFGTHLAPSTDVQAQLAAFVVWWEKQPEYGAQMRQESQR